LAGNPRPNSCQKQPCAREVSGALVKPEPPQTSQSDDQSDPAIKKAKATITAKMAAPASVEFVEIKRASGANALGNSSDIVCGFVGEKYAGPRPFLYLVPKDEAYTGVTV
jgi:hypothetical protein